MPELAKDDKEGKAAQDILKKKFTTLEMAMSHALNKRNFNAAKMLTVHVPGYWEGHIQANHIFNLDRNELEFLCEHHPERDAMKANILKTIKENPQEFFTNLMRKGSHGVSVVPYLIKTYRQEVIDLLLLPEVSRTWRLLPGFNREEGSDAPRQKLPCVDSPAIIAGVGKEEWKFCSFEVAAGTYPFLTKAKNSDGIHCLVRRSRVPLQMSNLINALLILAS